MGYLRQLGPFLLGKRIAIDWMARTRWAWVPGLILVLTAGIARNYDHNFMPLNLRWLAVPVGVSLVSSWFIFAVARLCLRPGRKRRDRLGLAAKSDGKPSFTAEYAGFFACYLATAPLAWLYALPVELWLPYLQAAQANLWLLALVSVWRVTLTARVASVLTGTPYLASLAAILLPCSIEALAASFAAALGTIDVAAGMGGLAQGPKKELMGGVYVAVFLGSAICFVASLVALLVWRRRRDPGKWRPFPSERPGPPVRPWAALTVLLLVAALVVPMQRKMHAHHVAAAFPLGYTGTGGRHTPQREENPRDQIDRQREELVQARQLLDHLARTAPDHFHSARLLPPRSWDRGIHQVTGVLGAFREDDPLWLYLHYLEHACILRARGGGYFYVMKDDRREFGLLPELEHFLRLGDPGTAIAREAGATSADKAALAGMRRFILEGRMNPWTREHLPEFAATSGLRYVEQDLPYPGTTARRDLEQP